MMPTITSTIAPATVPAASVLIAPPFDPYGWPTVLGLLFATLVDVLAFLRNWRPHP